MMRKMKEWVGTRLAALSDLTGAAETAPHHRPAHREDPAAGIVVLLLIIFY